MATSQQSFRTAFIWVASGALLFVLWHVRTALLLAFGAILVAILLGILSDWIAQKTKLPRGLGLLVATCLVLSLVVGTLWMFGAQISGQFSNLFRHVADGEKYLSAMLKRNGAGGLSLGLSDNGSALITNSLGEVASLSLGVAEGTVVLLVSAIFLAADPALYRRGIVALFRPQWRDHAGEALDLIGTSLKMWLLGQLILMVSVGILTYIAVLLLGLPNPTVLALVAGFTEAVPYLGPFVGAGLALLVALNMGWETVLATAAAYALIHIFEGYVLGPWVQQRFVFIPPAVIIIGITAATLLFGSLGAILAAPMTVAVFVAVKVLYVRDTLNEPTALPEDVSL